MRREIPYLTSSGITEKIYADESKTYTPWFEVVTEYFLGFIPLTCLCYTSFNDNIFDWSYNLQTYNDIEIAKMGLPIAIDNYIRALKRKIIVKKNEIRL